MKSFQGRPTSVPIDDDGRLVGPFELFCRTDGPPTPMSSEIGDTTLELRGGELLVRWPQGEAVFDIAALSGVAVDQSGLSTLSSAASTDGRSVFPIKHVSFRTDGGSVSLCVASGTALAPPR